MTMTKYNKNSYGFWREIKLLLKITCILSGYILFYYIINIDTVNSK